MGDNVCTICALPFAAEEASSHRCDECIRQPPTFGKVTAAFEFKGPMLPLWHRVKFGASLYPLKSLTLRALPWFKAALVELEPDFILPMPLHFTRRFRRGYNQSYLLAKALQEQAGSNIPILRGIRRAYRRPQARKTREARLAMLEGGFRFRAKIAQEASKVLLVDDVLTTGATAESLSRVLKEAGATRVDVFVLGRVAK